MPRQSVAIVDTGVANVFSITRAIQELGGSPHVTDDPRELSKADRVIIPGVGSYASTMAMFAERGIDQSLVQHAEAGRPLMGICLGMQLLAASGYEEGHTRGLGLMPGEAVPLPSARTDGSILRRPHIGWSRVIPSDTVPLSRWSGSGQGAQDFYFAHSFTVTAPDAKVVAATFEYGGHELIAVIQQGTILGVQFHPERSGPAGLLLLEAFITA